MSKPYFRPSVASNMIDIDFKICPDRHMDSVHRWSVLICHCRCLPELALSRPWIPGSPCLLWVVWKRGFKATPEELYMKPPLSHYFCVCVCMFALTGIQLWIYWSNFNGTLVTVHCYCLVVQCTIWKELLDPFLFFGGMGYPLFPQQWQHSASLLSSVLEVILLITTCLTSSLPSLRNN